MQKVHFLAAMASLTVVSMWGQLRDAAELQKLEPFRAVDASASPRISRLRADIDAGRSARVSQFWDEIQLQRSPLVEPVPGDRHSSLVTFLWRGKSDTHNVVLIGGAAGTDLKKNQMYHLDGSDVWFKTYKIRNDARFIYSLSPNDSLIPIEKIDPKDREAMNKRLSDLRPDPLNPRHDPGLMPSSYVELSEAPPQTYITPDARVPKGKVEKRRFSSTILRNERDVWVYTPPGFMQTGGHYPLLVLFDGPSYIDIVPTPVILDNLIAKGLIPAMVAISVGNTTAGSRAFELPCSAEFADFLAIEIAPFMRKNYNATERANDVAIGGSSLGGLAAAFVALKHPEVFGNVLSQSGSFWWKPDGQASPEWLTKQFADSPKLNIRMFLEVGLMEDGATLTGPSMLDTNRRMKDALIGKGYAIHYQEFNGGHEYLNWRGSFADGLIYLFGDWKSRLSQ
jgi:enterochelin esterase-like enzyme